MEAKKQENEKVSNLQAALQKEGVIDNTDERRIMILKAQNGHLTRANANLHEVVKAQKKIILETENVLSDLQSMCKAALQGADEKETFLKKLENKLPEFM